MKRESSDPVYRRLVELVTKVDVNASVGRREKGGPPVAKSAAEAILKTSFCSMMG